MGLDRHSARKKEKIGHGRSEKRTLALMELFHAIKVCFHGGFLGGKRRYSASAVLGEIVSQDRCVYGMRGCELYIVPWDDAALRGGRRGLPHRSRRGAERLTNE
jgi:hypothetical protein